MLKRFIKLCLVGFVAANFSGCVAVMAGLAESAKAKQTLNVSYSRAFDIVKGSFKTLDVQFVSADVRPNITQIKAKDTEERTVRIFITKISDSETSIAVRVGTSEAGKARAEQILQAIIDYSDLTSKQ
ncbi:MAG: DUF3568 domain-containing protein [Candidatus Omnitrophica bacterium]|jgi:hypothetical protein|nr:DUF3568 domain-containing protein [Candidatus Omnitrophota bacterium]